MKRHLAVASVITIVLVSTVGLGTAAAQEGIPESDTCQDAPVLEPGSYSSTLTPDGADRFRLPSISEGEYIVFDVEFDTTEISTLEIGAPSADDVENSNWEPWITEKSAVSDEWGVQYGTLMATNDGRGKLYMEADAQEGFCTVIETADDGAGGYAFSFDVNSDEPPTLATESRVNQLEAEINDLEAQLDEKNQRIDDLQSQLENADVTIDVSVEPAGQASFSAGGEMAVDVDAQGTAPSDVTLRFAGDAYTPTDGVATISLEAAGTQQLTVEYEDMVETVTLDVEPSDQDTADDGSARTTGDDGSTETDPPGGTTGGSGPGFGPVVALAGLGSAGYLLQRRNDDETGPS